MGQNQGFGAFLIAFGVLAFFLVSQVRARIQEDPRWLLRGELRAHLGPAAELINAVVLVFGTALGASCVAAGLLLLRWV